MSVSDFGVTAEGAPCRLVRISDGALSVELIEFGCVTRDIRLEGLGRSLVLSLPTLADYEANAARHLGAVAGRVANRIAGGRFEIDGKGHQASCNVGGVTTLHGGDRGFGRSMWSLVDHGPDRARFRIRQEDGWEGFPGAIEAEADYRVAGGALSFELTARAEAATICNLAQHSYYNLSGEDRVDGHLLELAAGRLTPLGPDMCPTGEVRAVTPEEDFRTPRPLGPAPRDVNYVLADAPRAEPAFAARLSGGGVAMEMETTAPGVQLYTADGVAPPIPGRNGRRYGPRSGVCLEAQHWPDAPNHPGFPPILLRPGELWRQLTRIRFLRA